MGPQGVGVVMFDVEDRSVWSVSLCVGWQVGNWMSTGLLSGLPLIGEVTSVLGSVALASVCGMPCLFRQTAEARSTL